ncbi:MAG: uL13 family ribosomal protein, partial [Patescibacteria group bacterium]
MTSLRSDNVGMQHIIDATHKTVGRLATQIATILQGKHRPDYHPRLPGTDTVRVKNVSQLSISTKKLTQKKYYRHSGPLGHLKERKLKDVFARKPA